MAKPIFTIGIPEHMINSYEDLEEIEKNLQEKLKDYHTIVYLSCNDCIDFNCYNGKMYNKKSEELEKVIRIHFKNKNNET